MSTPKTILTLLIVILSVQLSIGQLYTEKKTRHRFAQMNVGLSFKMINGGQTSYLDEQGAINPLSLSNSYVPGIIIGGTHFWGHADFELVIPVYSQSVLQENQSIFFTSGVETIFKYYPWRIEHKKLRPYIGTSLAPFYYSQDNTTFEFANGPEKSFTRLPLLAGLSYNGKQHLFSLGLSYNYRNTINYAISKTQVVDIKTPPLAFNIAYKYMFDTTIGAESSWESGKTKELTDKLSAMGKLNNFFLGVGLSSAWWLRPTTLNKDKYSFIPTYDTNIMADFTLGYYFHKPDLDISLNYRAYTGGTNVYGVIQAARRRSVALEVKKFLFDYHGFVPFIGPVVSYEDLFYRQRVEAGPVLEQSDQLISYGLTFGWDIRPNRIQTFILRTNLRYFPSLNLKDVDGSSVNYDNIEFNFIQLILYPGRMF